MLLFFLLSFLEIDSMLHVRICFMYKCNVLCVEYNKIYHVDLKVFHREGDEE